MENIKQQVLTASCTDEYEEAAANALLDRALLYNRDKKNLNIIVGRKPVPLNAVDNENIIKDKNNVITLADDITVSSVTSISDGNSLPWKSQSKIFETSNNHSTILLFKQSTNGIAISGTNGYITASGLDNNSITFTYESNRKFNSCKISISGGDSEDLLINNAEMPYADGAYSYTTKSTTFTEGSLIYVMLTVNDGDTKYIPQGNPNDITSWSNVVYSPADEASVTPAVIGGEIIEVGSGILGHYQISVTSSGSRLLKGATTFDKKAKIVLAKYKKSYYYGIKFKSDLLANIYFAGWQYIPESLIAPAYTEYGDSDLSEVIELDDDSDTGTQVIEDIIKTYPNRTWEFIGNTSSNFSTNQSINSEGYYDYGAVRIYPNANNNAKITINTAQNSVTVEGIKVTPWRIEVEQDGGSVTFDCKNSTNRNTNIVLYGSDATGNVDFTNTIKGTHDEGYINGGTEKTYLWENLKKGWYWIRQGSGNANTIIEYYNISITQENSFTEQNKDSEEDSQINLGYGLLLNTSKSATWSEGPILGNYGIITVNKAFTLSKPMAILTVSASCTIIAGIHRPDDKSSNLRISETLTSNTDLWNKSVSMQAETDRIVEVRYNYSGDYGKEKDIYFMNETGAIDLLYVKVIYNSLSDELEEDIIQDAIESLPSTGADGTPHTIRLSGPISKDTIIAIASSIRNDASKQVIVDLSRCTIEKGCENWSTESGNVTSSSLGDLTNAFKYCIGLRAFYYPHNVTNTGRQTFMHCAYLREVHLNPEMQTVGYEQWSDAYTGIFAGTRISSIFIPKSVTGFNGYSFSYSNIVNVYCEEGTNLVDGYTGNNWAEWSHTRNQKYFFAKSDYDIRKQTSTQFASSADTTGIPIYVQRGTPVKDSVYLWENYESLDDPEFSISYSD